jgi:ubiquinone/menaquinone biosynthesis C-methylase UbiE
MGILVKTNSIKKDENARKEYWEQQFGTSYKIGNITEQNREILTSLVKNIKPGKMLDNGCGDGRLKKFYEGLGWKVYGTDISENAIIQASKITPLNLVCSLSESLPFKDSFFDVVFSWRVFHSLSLENRKKALKEVDRVLNPKGTFIYSVQSAEDTHTIEKYKSMGIEDSHDENSYVSNMDVEGKVVQRLKHFYTREDVIAEIETNTNLKVVDIQTYEEKSGWNKDNQMYWIIKATRQ